MSDRHEGTSREELIEAAARIFAAGWYGDSDRVDDTARQLADGWLQGVLPLIEADLRDRLAKEIEAIPYSPELAEGDNGEWMQQEAARIVRGGDR